MCRGTDHRQRSRKPASAAEVASRQRMIGAKAAEKQKRATAAAQAGRATMQRMLLSGAQQHSEGGVSSSMEAQNCLLATASAPAPASASTDGGSSLLGADERAGAQAL